MGNYLRAKDETSAVDWRESNASPSNKVALSSWPSSWPRVEPVLLNGSRRTHDGHPFHVAASLDMLHHHHMILNLD